MAAVRAWAGGSPALGRGQRIGLLAGAVVVVVVVAVVLAAVLSGGNKPSKRHVVLDHLEHGRTANDLDDSAAAQDADPKICPLTGRAAPGGKVPSTTGAGREDRQRPGLAPAKRPRPGRHRLRGDGRRRDHALHGRLPVPGRTIDRPGPLGPLGRLEHPCSSTGTPSSPTAAGSTRGWKRLRRLPWIYNADGSIYPTANAYYRYNSSSLPASLGAPYNYYTSTKALWALFPDAKMPPPDALPVLDKGPRQAPIRSCPPRSRSRAPRPSSGSGARRTGSGCASTTPQPDADPAGQQLHTTNVVIQMVTDQEGPYNESGPDSHDVESITTGTGTAYVLRDGHHGEGDMEPARSG